MGETGIIRPDEHVELLDGELIVVPPPSPEHEFFVDRVSAVFHRCFDGRAIVRTQGSFHVDEWSQPQPDVTLLVPPLERYRRAKAIARDTLLVVEVAKTSLAFDRGKKLRAYARAHVREYWVLNVERECIDIYRDPVRERYRDHRTLQRGESIALVAFPDDALTADELLGAPERVDA